MIHWVASFIKRSLIYACFLGKSEIVDLKKDFESTPYEIGYWTTTLIRKHIYQETGTLYSKSRLSELMRECFLSGDPV